jgi:hypothetical protein
MQDTGDGARRTGLSARGATDFAVDFKIIAARYGIRTRKDGAKICCLDVRLVA